MIFCVEDDHAIRDLMIYTLHSAGFQAEGFTDGSSLFTALLEKQAQLILLDVMLPGEDGISILKKLKANYATCDTPVIIASAKGTEYDKVIGLDLGADDYLAKPFGMMEMLSRVKAVLRRTAPKPAASLLRIGDLELNADTHTVYLVHNNGYTGLERENKSEIELTLKEFELLHLFMSHPGIVYTRDVLLAKIWDSDYLGGTRTVDVHVGNLRTKLGAYGGRIKTVRGVGYKLEEMP
ncbi:MAG: response regulator transcription factor [Eubacterium sp.]|nr:response regulator transcription factor [Eubacterium sp.]